MPDNGIPSAVADKVRRVEALIAEQARQRGDGQTMPPAAPVTPAPTMPPTPPVPTVVPPAPLTGNSGQPGSTTEPPTAGSVPQPGAVPDAGAELQQTRQALQVLQGKYNAELTQLRQQMAQQEQVINLLLQQTTAAPAPAAAGKPATGQPAAPVPVPALDVRKYYDEATITEYGEEFLRKQLQAMQQLTQQQVQPMAQQVQQSRQMQFQDHVAMRLRAAGISFEELNQNPAFLDWLKQPTSGYGRETGLDVLSAAVQSGDAEMATRVFQAGAQAITAPATPAAPASRIAEQMLPGSVATPTGVQTGGGQARTYPAAEWQALFGTLSRVIPERRTPEQVALFNELNLAVAEGRVRSR